MTDLQPNAELRGSLGELLPLYEEFAEIWTSTPEGTVLEEYYPMAQLDHMAKAMAKLPENFTPEQYTQAEEEGRYSKIDARDYAVLQAKFVGSVSILFKQFVNLETDEAEFMPESFAAQLQNLKAVPPEFQRIATVRSDGYYIGGRFHFFRDEV